MIVIFKVAALSHPAALVKCVVTLVDAVYVTPLKVKLLHAVAELLDVLLWLIVKFNVAAESHPAALVR